MRNRDAERQRRADEQTNYRTHFLQRLARVRTFDEAVELAADAPPPDSIGRICHTNLQHFLQAFTLPGQSTAAERAGYRALIVRLDEAGALKPGVRERVERAIAEAPSYP
jgi:hypothetical protein